MHVEVRTLFNVSCVKAFQERIRLGARRTEWLEQQCEMTLAGESWKRDGTVWKEVRQYLEEFRRCWMVGGV